MVDNKKEQFIKLLNESLGFAILKNLDLSNVNLESISIGSGFKLVSCIENVNFENSKITINLDNISIYNSNLKGTNLLFDEFSNIRLSNVILDENAISNLNKVLSSNQHRIDEIIDMLTLINNKGLNVTANNFFKLLRNHFYTNRLPVFMTMENIIKFDDFIEKVLDVNTCFKTIYKNIENQLNIVDKINFFTKFTLVGKTIENITITQEMMDFIDNIELINCNFENVVFDFDISKNLIMKQRNIEIKSVKNINMPNLKFNDWNKIEKSRFKDSPITFKKNLYIELGRKCNAQCTFCRNECMEKVSYNYPNIKHNLYKIIDNIDSIVVGGGEPTLMQKDLIDLLSVYWNYTKKFFIFSNGTKTQSFADKITENISYYISRHSYDEEVNAKILGIKSSKVMANEELKYFCMSDNVNLSCTCINGGIDTPEKIFNYISTFIDYSKDIMFCNLMKDASVNLEDNNSNELRIDDRVFDEIIEFLIKQGFDYRYPIISTGGYELFRLKSPNFNRSVTLKKYISKEELEEKWPTAIKRTFDLSMSPDGSIYENWAETGEKVKVIRK